MIQFFSHQQCNRQGKLFGMVQLFGCHQSVRTAKVFNAVVFLRFCKTTDRAENEVTNALHKSKLKSCKTLPTPYREQMSLLDAVLTILKPDHDFLCPRYCSVAVTDFVSVVNFKVGSFHQYVLTDTLESKSTLVIVAPQTSHTYKTF